MVTERETKYGKVFNPERPHDGDNSATRTISMEIPETPGWRAILKDFKRVAVDKECSVSHLYREALLDYHGKKLMQTDTEQPPAVEPETTATTETKPTVETAKPEQVRQPYKPRTPKPDFDKMTDDELLKAHKSARWGEDYRFSEGEHQVIAGLLKKRGIYPAQEPVRQL